MILNLTRTASRLSSVTRLFSAAVLATTLTFAATPATFADDGVSYAKKLSEAFENVALTITPSVVTISASKKPRQAPLTQGRRGSRPPVDPFFEQFRQFFGDDFAERFGAPDGGDQGGQQGLGTGVIVDEKGLILTNNHVVGDADEIEIRLHDGRKFKAELVGRDERSDLAVIRINKGSGLVAAKLGDSNKLKIGEWVVAAGNPFGLDNSITAGIVSAKGRSIMGGGQFEDFIQTDAAINPGNSGGPLVNLEGEVVGINTAIFSRSGGYMGIGFAIPISMARTVMESLISNGKVVRGWLGVGIQNLSEDLAASFNYPGTEGALVGHLDPQGPAFKAGLKQGDILTKLDGEKLKDVNQLRNKVASTKPGTAVALEFIRDGRTQSISVKVGELPGSTESGGTDSGPETPDLEQSVGLAVEDLSPQVARRLGTSRKSGAVVVGVRNGSLAAQAGLAPMDIVLSVNGKEVTSGQALREALKKADLSRGARLVVETQGMERFVFLKGDEE